MAGIRAGYLMRDGASFPLALRVQGEGAPLGEIMSFISGLYFRGKLAYARAFAPSGAWVITPNLEAAKYIKLTPRPKIRLFNGALDCRFMRYELYAGSRRRDTPDQATGSAE